MSKDGIRVEEFNIYSLGAEAVSYHLKDIHTLALQVTAENIGILSLEFETELIYTSDNKPYINIHVARGPKEDPESDRNLIIRPNDWLVILWDEIHLFKDPEFRSTFSFDGLSAPRMTDEDVKEVAKHLNEERPPYVPTDAVPATDLETDKTVWLRPDAYNSLDESVKERFRLFEPAVRMNEVEKTQIVPAAGNLYPEGEGTGADAETERKIGERIDSQPWMQQARAEIAEKDGGNTREQQL